MKKSAIIPYAVLAALFAVGCVSSFIFFGGTSSALKQPHQRDYPDTCFASPRLPPPGEQVVQATHQSTGPGLVDLAYEDIVHPDEDLLLPDGAHRVRSSSPANVTPPPASPPLDSWPTQIPAPTTTSNGINFPPEVTAPNLEPEPQLTIQQPTTTPSQTSTPPETSAPTQPETPPASVPPSDSGRRFDPNRGPAPDEDLLLPDGGLGTNAAPSDSAPNRGAAAPQATPEPAQPAPPSSTPSEVTPPIEVLPVLPREAPHEPPVPRPQPPRTLPQTMAPHATGISTPSPYVGTGDPHLEVFAKSLFPSAKECRACHETIYDEWAGSSHAYAALSPMFQKFEQTINALTQGTIGYFCQRCHAPVATTLGYPREAPITGSIPSATEGVTCVACHRVIEEYGKVNGERRIEPGTVNDPVMGSGFGEGLAEVLSRKDYYKVKTGPHETGPGQQIHNRVIHFDQLSSSHFCVSCHQVAVFPGIKLEVVWEQYRASPAHKMGITCQECHMGQEPGVAQGYTTGPAAVIGGKEINPHRKHSNHTFYGPGYSIAHPGTFPINPDADEWSVEEWLQFDYRSGWGTEKFEELVQDGKIQVQFPPIWENSDDRIDAREIVDANLDKLEAKRRMRHRLMENGSCVKGPVFARQPKVGHRLNFHYTVHNSNLGHNMPSGSLGAQPQIWLNVALTGPNGQHLWESGYVDRNGDLADLHSLEVAARRIRPDQQLFNLQTKFLISHVKGTDREFYLPVNIDFDQLPFIRPSAFPISVMNHPPFIRMEGHSLPPLGSRNANYKVPGHLIQQPGQYRLSVRMRSRAEPIYFMRFCNATPEMERNMNEWMLDYHEEYFDFYVAP